MKNTAAVVLSLIAVLGMPQVAFADGDGDSDGDSDRKTIRIQSGLSGAQEVPAVMTDTTGNIKIEFNHLLSKARFVLKVNDGVAITQAHIHCGRAGENGPVVAFLFGFLPGGTDVDGRLSKGTLTNDDFLGSDCATVVGVPINNIASLALAARAGLVYVNVHSAANPPGEVRGQLFAH